MSLGTLDNGEVLPADVHDPIVREVSIMDVKWENVRISLNMGKLSLEINGKHLGHDEVEGVSFIARKDVPPELMVSLYVK